MLHCVFTGNELCWRMFASRKVLLQRTYVRKSRKPPQRTGAGALYSKNKTAEFWERVNCKGEVQ